MVCLCQIPPGLFVFVFPDRIAVQIIEQDLTAGIAVVCDIAAQPLDVVDPAPGVAVDLHETNVTRCGGKRRYLLPLPDVLAPAAFLPASSKDDLAVKRLVFLG